MTATTIVFLIGGVAGLVLGAEALVRGAARLAARTGMSSVVIGLTVVAFGTSAPELAVSLGDVLAGGEDAGSIAIGNVIGSNIANILLALGVAAALGGGLIVAQRIVRLDVPIMIGASVAMLIFSLNGKIGRAEGALLTVALVVYITRTVVVATRSTAPAVTSEYDEAFDSDQLAARSVWSDLGFVTLGLLLLVVSSQALVKSASDIATSLGVSDLVIGLTVVAIGTSLPEVATSVLAAIRGQRDLAVGNAIGSNLFNLLAVLGITALVAPNPLPVATSAIQVDIPVMVAVAVACLPIFADGHVLNRWEGFVFLGYYAGYLTWLVLDASENGLRDSYGDVVLFLIVPITTLTLAIIAFRGRRRPNVELS
ncbi:MAG: sodium:calcium antiporter [Actinobacteria bacterium]|nr:MAG: sodium:calcium antiporter [Actinomycetota bacterium]